MAERPEGYKFTLAGRIAERLRDFPELLETLSSALVDEPPSGVKDGGIFRDGFHEGLDELRRGSREGKQWIADLQAREAERTGIKRPYVALILSGRMVPTTEQAGAILAVLSGP